MQPEEEERGGIRDRGSTTDKKHVSETITTEGEGGRQTNEAEQRETDKIKGQQTEENENNER